MAPLVELNGLVKEFHSPGLIAARRRSIRAVDGVSLGIGSDSIFGLVGESGCGKTSLARALLYLDPPSAGEVRFDGIPLGRLSPGALKEMRSHMQIVFQDPNSALDPRLRVGQSLEEGLVNRRVPREERQRRVSALLKRVGLSPDQRSRYPHQFSSGQKQRLVIARALAVEPDFLILDEPVSNLDVSIQAQIINLLLDLKRELALTFLFISHDLNLVAYLSDTIAVMHRGRIVEQADAEELVARPLHPYTRRLFASLPGHGGLDETTPQRDETTPQRDETTPQRDETTPQRDETTPQRDETTPAPGGPGCGFVPACPRRHADCLTRRPELTDTGNGHLVACPYADLSNSEEERP